MNTTVRTNHTTRILLKIGKAVAVLLLILLPTIAQAQTSNRLPSSNRWTAPASYQLVPSFQMTNTSAYQVSTTYNPAQTVYAPFSDESPAATGNNGQSGISGRRNAIGNPGNPGQNPNETDSPLGDAWSLLIFAALAAGVIKVRRLKVKG